MNIRIWVEASEYATAGWSMVVTQNDDEWHTNYMKDKVKKGTAFCLTSVSVEEPSLDNLAGIGHAASLEMQDKLALESAKAQAKIKEFESKFLLLK